MTHPLTTVSPPAGSRLAEGERFKHSEAGGCSFGVGEVTAAVDVPALAFLEAWRIARMVGGREEYSGGEIRMARRVTGAHRPLLSQRYLQLSMSRLYESLYRRSNLACVLAVESLIAGQSISLDAYLRNYAEAFQRREMSTRTLTRY